MPQISSLVAHSHSSHPLPSFLKPKGHSMAQFSTRGHCPAQLHTGQPFESFWNPEGQSVSHIGVTHISGSAHAHISHPVAPSVRRPYGQNIWHSVSGQAKLATFRAERVRAAHSHVAHPRSSTRKPPGHSIIHWTSGQVSSRSHSQRGQPNTSVVYPNGQYMWHWNDWQYGGSRH